MAAARKSELKKQVWALLRDEAEVRGLAYKNQETPFLYRFDDVTSGGLSCVLQTRRDTPDVWCNPHASVRRDDVALLQRELGINENGGIVYSMNLGYLMSDREQFHDWVFVDRDLHSGKLLDLTEIEERITYGDHHAVVGHLFDAFFNEGLPKLRKFTDIDALIQVSSRKYNVYDWPLLQYIAGRYDQVEMSVAENLSDYEEKGLDYHAVPFRQFAEKLFAKINRIVPDPPRVITPQAYDPRRLELIEFTFRTQLDAEGAHHEFTALGIDGKVKESDNQWSCTIWRVIPDLQFDNRYLRKMDKIAAKHGGTRRVITLAGINDIPSE